MCILRAVSSLTAEPGSFLNLPPGSSTGPGREQLFQKCLLNLEIKLFEGFSCPLSRREPKQSKVGVIFLAYHKNILQVGKVHEQTESKLPPSMWIKENHTMECFGDKFLLCLPLCHQEEHRNM